MRISRAKPDDAATPSEIAFAAKRHCEYTVSWIERTGDRIRSERGGFFTNAWARVVSGRSPGSWPVTLVSYLFWYMTSTMRPPVRFKIVPPLPEIRSCKQLIESDVCPNQVQDNLSNPDHAFFVRKLRDTGLILESHIATFARRRCLRRERARWWSQQEITESI